MTTTVSVDGVTQVSGLNRVLKRPVPPTAEDCSDPGIPPGAQRSAGPFQLGQKLSYSCQTGLDLLGSAERVCLENREWSGSTPRCLGRNTYDSPSEVAKAMTGSLAGLMDVLSPEEKKTRA